MNKMILKRDGSLVPFNLDKIALAIEKSFKACGYDQEIDENVPYDLANKVLDYLENRDIGIPTVEFVQDIVEEVLIKENYMRGAKAYILYRDKRNIQRKVASSLVGSFEEMDRYQPKNRYYNSPKVRARVFGEISLKKYFESNSFDCFMAKALEERLVIFDNLPYLHSAVYQYVIDSAKIEAANPALAFTRLYQLIVLFDKYQTGPVKIVNFSEFLAKFQPQDHQELSTLVAVLNSNVELFNQNQITICSKGIAQEVRELFCDHFEFGPDCQSDNIAFNITIDFERLRIKSADFGIDTEGLETRIIEFLNRETKNLFKDCLALIGTDANYLATHSYRNQICIANLSNVEEIKSLFPKLNQQSAFEDKINVIAI